MSYTDTLSLFQALWRCEFFIVDELLVHVLLYIIAFKFPWIWQHRRLSVWILGNIYMVGMFLSDKKYISMYKYEELEYMKWSVDESINN